MVFRTFNSLVICAAAISLLALLSWQSATAPAALAVGHALPGPGYTPSNITGACILEPPEPGLDLDKAFFVTQKAAGERDEAGDEFSKVVLTGDFNGDGFEEQVVGAPGENGGAGAVSIFLGAEEGITKGSVITLSGVGGAGAPGDRFGASLEAGDFDLDGIEDLVVGAPGKVGTGAVYIFLGSVNGFGASYVTLTSGDLEPGDGFGETVLVGDFGADGIVDLAVGAPDREDARGSVFVYLGEAIGPFEVVFPGKPTGPGLVEPEELTQTGIDGATNGAGDRFGAALGNGDFYADGADDLVVGVPDKEGGHGVVYIYNGEEEEGLITEPTEVASLTQDDAGETGAAGDAFGAAVNAANVNGDLSEELLVGAPGKNGSGAVFIFQGALTNDEEEVTVDPFETASVITQEDVDSGTNGPGDRFGAALANGDFTGDDFEDLAVGAPGKAGGAGAVSLFLGGEEGITTGIPVDWSGVVAGLGGRRDDGDDNDDDEDGEDEDGEDEDGEDDDHAAGGASAMFGAAVIAGDFNGDGYEELTVGAPGQRGSGVFYVFPAIAVSPSAFTQIHAGDVSKKKDRFGASQAVGDFNDDRIEDLAVGIPGKNGKRGAVAIFLGSEEGLTRGCIITRHDADGYPVGDADDEDDDGNDGEKAEFGAALAAGDFNEDDVDDLAVGAPRSGDKSGAVFIFPGSAEGLTRGFVITQAAVDGYEAEEESRFGAALTVANFDGDDFADLAVGAPGGGRGAAFVFPGSDAGITTGAVVVAHWVSVDDDGDEEDMLEDSRFGAALTAGDFNDDDFDDLAVGAYRANHKTGAVFIFLGSEAGVTAGGYVTQAAAGEVDETGDKFGKAVAAGDFDGDGFADLVVGAPGEAPGLDPRSGIVFIFGGSEEGLTDGFFITQADTEGIYPGSVIAQTEVNEQGDRFGEILLAADFDQDDVASLVVGAPGESPGPWPRSGAIFFFRGIEDDGIRTREDLEKAVDDDGDPLPIEDYNFFYTQTDFGGEDEKGDKYGLALAAGDFDGDEDAHKDLAVGAPGEAFGFNPRSSGGVNIIPFIEIEL